MEDGSDSEFQSSRGSKRFGVHISKDSLKFTAAHFIAFKGFRERLHGHNYRVGLKVWGTVGEDGYVVDFGVVKTALRGLCKKINQHVILPTRSDVLTLKEVDENVQVDCEDGSTFSFPKKDCKLLPIVHTSAEELAEYLLWRSVKHFTKEYLLNDRKVTAIEISVAEAENQYATHYVDFTKEGIDSKGNITPTKRPRPCLCQVETCTSSNQ